MQPAKYPKEPFTQYMRPKRMHYFTLIQIALFILLLIFRAVKVIAIAFPIVIKACIPVRMYLLPRIFTTEELIMIDTDDAVVAEYLAYKEQKNNGGSTAGDTMRDVEFESSDEETGDKAVSKSLATGDMVEEVTA